MQFKKLVVPAAAVAVAGALVIAPSTVSATTFQHFVGYAGGTAVKAVGSTVQSDLTSASSVDAITTGVKTANTAATVQVPNVALVAGVNTSAETIKNADNSVSVKTVAQTAGISLFDGAIVAKAVTTTNIATVHPDHTVSSSIQTQFLGLKVGALNIPATVQQNTRIVLPNIATVILNAAFTAGDSSTGTIMTQGAGLYVSLLKPRGANNPIGTEVFLNPTYDAIATVDEATGATLFGNAYGSKIFAQVGNALNVYSGPTAQITCPINGTGGAVKTNTTATASLPNILLASAVTNTAKGVKAAAGQKSYVEMNTELHGLNLLGGAITADLIQGMARAETTGANNALATASTFTSLVNLSIGGKSIPVNVAPNTVITLGSLAKIIIREQSTSIAGSQAHAKVTALHVFLLQPYGQLQTGAEIIIGFAQADIVAPS